MSQADQPGGWSRRRFIQASAVGAAAAAMPAGASAQDGNTTDSDGGDTDGTTYEPPDDFIGDSQQAIGADSMLIGALKYDESDRTPDGITEAAFSVLSRDYATGDYYDTPSDLDDAASNGILQIDQMDNSSHHVLTGMFNEIQLATDKAWFDGMVAFLEEVDAGSDQSTCVNAATSAGVESQARIQQNLLTWWKEKLNQLEAFQVYLQESFDSSANPTDVLNANIINWTTPAEANGPPAASPGEWWRFDEQEVDLVDGSTISVPRLGIRIHHTNDTSVYDDLWLGPAESMMSTEIGDIGGDPWYVIKSAVPLFQLPDGSVTNGIWGYDSADPTTKQDLQDLVSGGTHPDLATAFEEELDSSLRRLNMYHVLWDWLVQEADLIEANLNEWANNTYGSIQAGEIDIAGIIQANPTLAASEFATEYSSTGRYSYVAASMASMGVAYDYEHEMHVQLHDGTELTGTMFVSQSDFSVEVGTTVNPDNLSDEGHVYFAYDAGSAQRELPTSEYQEDIDGGVATLTTTPVEGTVYALTTVEDETVEIQHDQWNPVDEQAATDPDATTDWEIDLSDELETAITSVESIVHRYPEGTGADLIRLTEPFKITEAYNVETGEETDNVDGEQGTDLSETDVQFTEEDLEAFREMVEAVKEDADRPPAGGGGGGIDLDLGGDWLPDQIMGFPTEYVLLTGGAILIYGVVTN